MASGAFYSMPRLIGSQPRRLVMGPTNYRVVAKAREADVVIATAETFHDPPDLHATATWCSRRTSCTRSGARGVARMPKPEWMETGIPFIEREQEKERFQSNYAGTALP
jgi:hypothetical protein